MDATAAFLATAAPMAVTEWRIEGAPVIDPINSPVQAYEQVDICAGGAWCSLGVRGPFAVQYQLEIDGAGYQYSKGIETGGKACTPMEWNGVKTVEIRVKARCADYPRVSSDWSEPVMVDVECDACVDSYKAFASATGPDDDPGAGSCFLDASSQ